MPHLSFLTWAKHNYMVPCHMLGAGSRSYISARGYFKHARAKLNVLKGESVCSRHQGTQWGMLWLWGCLSGWLCGRNVHLLLFCAGVGEARVVKVEIVIRILCVNRTARHWPKYNFFRTFGDRKQWQNFPCYEKFNSRI